ncbi:DUF1405 domain-containing protein [Desulfoscipio geothermicus]|uniref:Uncharacterized membrane protein YpjA n=1 Tax=Desulfoscipio geothermicus DSM 3669 TaxID=1121426 RepID=A0A1I6DDG6_9FIRM|nr:DUF1405 domain-containing protein [Desulfoscipio geothermicus]SFR03401.1 Uncharacterized membrane protein YpjA [Desulfoscipio geothermicus DSM 3669]
MRLMSELLSELWRRPWRSSLVWPIIITNILGSVYGFYWYRAQLAETPRYLWALVPDSPLSTTLFALALLLVLAGNRPGLITAVACATTIKYGLWAVGMITHYWALGGPVNFTEVMLWLSHWGMALEGFIFLRTVPVPGRALLGASLWMIFNDYMDYFRGLHPYLFSPLQENFALWLAAGLTIVAFIALVRAWVCNHLPVN